jgi:hypothetical protein
LSTNQFLDSKISKASNNMEPQIGDDEIIIQLRIINQWMD